MSIDATYSDIVIYWRLIARNGDPWRYVATDRCTYICSDRTGRVNICSRNMGSDFPYAIPDSIRSYIRLYEFITDKFKSNATHSEQKYGNAYGAIVFVLF